MSLFRNVNHDPIDSLPISDLLSKIQIGGADMKLSSILGRLAKHGTDSKGMLKEFEKCLEEFGIEDYVKSSWVCSFIQLKISVF